MQAAGHYIAQNRPDFNIMYMATDTFINEFAISSIANKRLDFHARFKNVDLLLMDDIQFLKYKDATQKEFFSIFNNLQQAQKQIIITCDRLPREIPGIEEGLRNRFGCGLIADIQPPNYETRLAILQSKMKQGSVELPLNFLEMIASRITTNIRDLEGALNRICACVSLSDIEANEELVMKTINEIAPPAAYAAPSISQIIDAVCSHFNIDPESVAGGQRSHEIVLPRRIAMRLCKELTNQTLSVIGKSFGKKHATVIYSLKKLDEEMREDPNIAKTFRTIRNNLMPPV